MSHRIYCTITDAARPNKSMSCVRAASCTIGGLLRYTTSISYIRPPVLSSARRAKLLLRIVLQSVLGYDAQSLSWDRRSNTISVGAGKFPLIALFCLY